MEIISVASAKGGVGKSAFCCGVGKMLSFKGKRTLLIDMDIGVRSLDILLNVADKTVFNWGDVLKGNCDYRKAIIDIGNELYLLPAPIDFSDSYTVEAFCEMIKAINNKFDFIILDSPAGLESGFKLAAGVSDMCVVVSTPDRVSIRAATYAADNMKKSGVENIRLVINKFNKKLHKNIDADEFIDTVCARLLGIIPESAQIYNSVNGNKIPFDCKGNQAFLRIANRLMGDNVPLREKNL